MIKKLLCVVLLLCSYKAISNWGFFAHKKINKMAVFTLPESMNDFFLRYIDLLEQQSVNADKRRYTMKNEAPRHYIDIDVYDADSPFVVVPKRWNEAVEKYSEDTLIEYGILPWHIQSQYMFLVNAFKNNNAKRVIDLCSDIGHYIADAHVPLHTTKNYNGQFTNQYGIHGFWESRLPELFADNYDYVLPPIDYVDNVLFYAWEIIEDSYHAKDSVLDFEAQLNRNFSSDLKYSFEEKGGGSKKVYSKEYSTAYHHQLNGMVERRLRESIYAIGSVWYSAWVDSGQPDMTHWEVNQK